MQVSLPAYLTKSTLYTVFGHQNVPVHDHSKWPSFKDMVLDESQYTALKKALTEEMALIQGPPGTGKTHFGVKLVEVLLDNIGVWNLKGKTPLLVICQSNLAIDNFLEGVLKFTNKIVRVGDCSQSRKLKPYALKELVCRWLVKAFPECREYIVIHSHLLCLDKSRQQLEELSKGIVSFKTLNTYIKAFDFQSEQKFLEWLGMHFKAEKKRTPELGTDLVVNIDKLSQHIYQLEVAGEHEIASLMKDNFTKVQNLVSSRSESIKLDVLFNTDDILSLSPDDACKVYNYWVYKFSDYLQNKIEGLEDHFKKLWTDEIPALKKLLGSLHVLQSSQVVGATSTGAASRRNIFRLLGAPIVVMDEAAELLESHIIASVTKRCEHLILLGDQKQLKPSLTTHGLQGLHLDVSLFERLQINEVLTGSCLTTQYRMRPEFSALLKPHIYEVLNDGPGTMGRPPIRGISKNLFFLNHEKREMKTKDLTGTWNPYEVKMLIKLAEYLVSKCYAPTDITIIAMYNEQKKKLIEVRDKSDRLSNLEIVSVDSFQGKENEIILLSLVRSNPTGNIGFLKQENRVCVALSRARSGFFIIGDMKCLTKGGRLWKHVSEELKTQDAIGMELTLVCEKHETVHKVSKVEDWCVPCSLCSKETRRKKNPHGERKRSKRTAVEKRTKYSQQPKEELKKNERKRSKMSPTAKLTTKPVKATVESQNSSSVPYAREPSCDKPDETEDMSPSVVSLFDVFSHLKIES